MEIKQFTEDPSVFHLVKELKEREIDRKQFSDLIDHENKQYVELVQEGGGVLGVALIGYTYVMEQMGLRFFSLAGTSAGSINSILLAAFGEASKSKSEKLIHELANKDLFEFVDGDNDAVDFVNAVVERARRVKLLWKIMQIIDNIFDDLGLNPGNDFFNWLTGILKDNNVETTKKLLDAFQKLPEGLKIREGVDRNLDGLLPRLALVTADITTESKVEFPNMRKLYWKEPESTNPAWYVRASMSIPYFFHPVVLKDIPGGTEAMDLWDDLTGYRGQI
ncbi:MAG: patatin-like phospholipase family protein, partial [bacterium]